MYNYTYHRPAIFLPGDGRRRPAYARRGGVRPDCRRTSDPSAPEHVRSSWRRSDACLRSWRVGGGGPGAINLELYFEFRDAIDRVLRRAGAAVRDARALAGLARNALIRRIIPG